MKQSFFSELSFALEGRPRIFRLIVISSLVFCSLVILEFAVQVAQQQPSLKKNVTVAVQKNQLLQQESMSLKGK